MTTAKCLLIGIGIIAVGIGAAHAAAPDSLWMRAYGDASTQEIRCINQTSDGGYIFAGSTIIEDISGGHSEAYVVKLDSDGDTLWTTHFRGVGDARAYAVRETPEGGYITAGYYGYLPLADDRNVCLVKLNSLGGILWERTYGGTGYDEAHDVRVLHGDSGFVVTGYTRSFGAYGSDLYLIRTDSAGDTLFTRHYGFTINDKGYSICETTDGYVMCGICQPPTGYDLYLVKTTSHLDTVWTRTYGGPELDAGYSIKLTPADFGFIIGGQTASFGAGDDDGWAVKTDLNGDTLWTRTVGDSLYNRFFSVDTTLGGGYVFAGQYGHVPLEERDSYAAKLAADGTLEWEARYGTADEDVTLSIEQTDGGRYIMGGYTKNWDTGDMDALVIRLGGDDESGVGPRSVPSGLAVSASPNPFTGSVRIEFSVATKAQAQLRVYDVAGRLVKGISSGTLYPGGHSFNWDGRDMNGAHVPPGIYFCRISVGMRDTTAKAVLAR
jgi:hypothetical protein